MGIEAIGRGIAVAPAISRVNIGPARIGGFPAPKFEVGIRNIANPFRVEGKAGRIKRHNYFPRRREYRGFSVPAVIAEAENIVSRAQNRSKVIGIPTRPVTLERKVSDWVRLPNSIPVPKPEFKPALAPKIESKPQVATGVSTESKASARTRVVSTPASMQAQQEQVVEEKVMTKQDQEKKSTKLREKASIIRVKFVEAIHISEQRRAEIKLAVKKAGEWVKQLGLKGITGRLVRQLLGDSFWTLTSPIVGRGKDGTIPLTAALVEADQTKYSSAEDAERNLVQAVDKHIPVKQGTGGRVATIEEVREVIEGSEKEIVKSQTAAEIVVKRLVRIREVSQGEKKAETAEEKVEAAELSLKDFPQVQDLFQKAAA